MRRTNTQPLHEDASDLRFRRLATLHEIPQTRARKSSSAVPTFTEVSAPRQWNRWGASSLIHFAALIVLIRIAAWLPKETMKLMWDWAATINLAVVWAVSMFFSAINPGSFPKKS